MSRLTPAATSEKNIFASRRSRRRAHGQPLGLNHVGVWFKIRRAAIEIFCEAETSSQTGVEMEALTGVSVAALTLYDMCKAVDKKMRIENIRVVEKIKE